MLVALLHAKAGHTTSVNLDPEPPEEARGIPWSE
jgi:hypothetical protein